MIYVGEIINTHGIKGEVKVASNFRFKEKVFSKKQNLYIGKNKQQVQIINHRLHRNQDLLQFLNHQNINDVLIYKGENLYIERKELPTDIILVEDIIGFEVFYNNELIGKVTSFFHNNAQEVLVIDGTQKHLIPFVDHFIEKIRDKKIYLNEVEGIINEN